MNKFAAIADIHGNLQALDAVLADINAQQVNSIVNLGDSLSGPLQAGLVAERLMSLDIPGVLGNHDRWLLQRQSHRPESWEYKAAQQLQTHHWQWLQAQPPTRLLDDEIFLCHGTPRCDNTYWTETVTPEGCLTMPSPEEISRRADGMLYPLMLCGHTHLQRAIRINEDCLLVNPGSVGCPAYSDTLPVPHIVQTGNTFACYAILEQLNGHWQVTFRQISYDRSVAIKLANESSDTEWQLALATGWIAPPESQIMAFP